jgi:hypothetical protein
MADPTDLPNILVTEPTLTDLMMEFERNIMLKLNCHAIGKIESFDSATQTAQVSFVYQRAFVEKQPNGTYLQVPKSYPLLAQCPVVSLYGGTAGLTFPITKGDNCIIFFNDRDLDIWFSYNQTTLPNSTRTHSLADAMVLVGLRTKANAQAMTYDTSHAKLYNGNTQVAVSSSKVKIDNSTYNLKTELTNLCTKLNGLCTAISTLTVTGVTSGAGVSGVPVNASTITTLGTDISTISTHLAGLLE